MAKWTFITRHGLVLAYIARNRRCTVREIAVSIEVTDRTVHNVLSDLETEGYIVRKKVGRNNVYSINPDTKLRHQTIKNVTIRELLKILGWSGPRRNSASGK